MRPTYIFAAICVPLLTCANDSGSPLPKGLANVQTLHPGTGGFVLRIEYLTEEFARRRDWEIGQIPYQPHICPLGRKIVRRDIRWYAPTSQSRRRCAAIIYVAHCRGKGTIDHDGLEESRRHLVGEIPDTAIPPECGNAAIESRIEDSVRDQPGQPGCPADQNDAPGKLVLYDNSAVALRTFMDRRLREKPPFSHNLHYYPRIPVQPIAARLRSERGRFTQFLQDVPAPDDGNAIQLTQTFGLSVDGTTHCVHLRAQRGPHVWSRRIDYRDPTPNAPSGKATSGAEGAAKTLADLLALELVPGSTTSR